MDLQMGSSMFESFLKYQASLRKNFHRLAKEYGFRMVDATPGPKKIHREVSGIVSEYLENLVQQPPRLAQTEVQSVSTANRRVRVEEG